MRNQRSAILLTFIGMYPLFWWGASFFEYFGSSPLWTTAPLLVALLVVSRLRAYYWLRERLNWRTQFITSLPVLAAMLAVLIALPFVRVYSVPDVSWRQIDAYFEQTKLPPDMPRMSPEKRRELIQYIEANNAVPAEYHDLYATMANDLFHPEDCSYEERLLVNYVCSRNRAGAVWLRGSWYPYRSYDSGDYRYLHFQSPWESARRDRILRVHIAAQLAEFGAMPDEEAAVFRRFIRRLLPYNSGSFDQWYRAMFVSQDAPTVAPVEPEFDDLPVIEPEFEYE
jgi:hypothetical protein